MEFILRSSVLIPGSAKCTPFFCEITPLEHRGNVSRQVPGSPLPVLASFGCNYWEMMDFYFILSYVRTRKEAAHVEEYGTVEFSGDDDHWM